MSKSPRLLITDDELEMREMLQEYFHAQGYAVSCAANAAQARSIMANETINLAVLDVRMPGEDGLSLARHIREHYKAGIIMLTAASETVDRILGLEIGADDYIVKPFDPRELLARVKSVLRRTETAEPSPAPISNQAHLVKFGLCLLNLETHRLATHDGKDVPITSIEYETLKVFAQNPNKVLSRERILDLTQFRDWDPFDRSVDIRITRLRKKIEVEPTKPQVIKTIRNGGYIFINEN